MENDRLKETATLIQDVFDAEDINVMEGVFLLQYMLHNILDNVKQEDEDNYDDE